MNIRFISQRKTYLKKIHTFFFHLLTIPKIVYEKTDYSVHFNDYNCFNENNHWGKMIEIGKKRPQGGLEVDLVS